LVAAVEIAPAIIAAILVEAAGLIGARGLLGTALGRRVITLTLVAARKT
jgi:hypothetical protein